MELNSFTYEEYEYILNSLKIKYDIVSFEEAYTRSMKHEDFFAVVRHDVDLDLSLALVMAEIENNLGISSTYFVLVSSDAYNIFSKTNRDILNDIILLGHNIGLHYNPLCYDVPSELESLNHEALLLETVLNDQLKVVSWHKPASLLVINNLKSAYLDTTQPPFFNEQMKYFADSRGSWRYGHPLESPEFKIGHPLHICFHPIWWSYKSMLAPDKLVDFCNRQDLYTRYYINREIDPFR